MGQWNSCYGTRPNSSSFPFNTTFQLKTPTALLFNARNIQILLYIAWIINILAIVCVFVLIIVIRVVFAKNGVSSLRNSLCNASMTCFRWIRQRFSKKKSKRKDQRMANVILYGSISIEDVIPEVESIVQSKEDNMENVSEVAVGDIDKGVSSSDTPSQPNWAKIEEERKQRFDEALKKREEILERQRRNREQLEREREKRTREMIAALINAVTHPLIEQTRKYHEWLETPD